MFGRFLAYRSYASNLVAGDTNSAADVFAPADPRSTWRRRDVRRGAAPQRQRGRRRGDGRHRASTRRTRRSAATANAAVYQSGFSNLVAGDTNGIVDAFLRAGVFGNGECDFIEATLPGLHGVRDAVRPRPLHQWRLTVRRSRWRWLDERAGAHRRWHQPGARHLHALLRGGRDQDRGPELRHADRDRQPEQRGGHGRDLVPAAVGRRGAGHAVHAAALRTQDGAARRAARHRRERPGAPPTSSPRPSRRARPWASIGR